MGGPKAHAEIIRSGRVGLLMDVLTRWTQEQLTVGLLAMNPGWGEESGDPS